MRFIVKAFRRLNLLGEIDDAVEVIQLMLYGACIEARRVVGVQFALAIKPFYDDVVRALNVSALTGEGQAAFKTALTTF